MVGRAPDGLTATYPIQGGVVSDFDGVEYMLKALVEQVHAAKKVLSQRPVMILSLPCGISEVEQRAVVEAARACGARKVYLIQEPVAAALGAGVDIFSEKASMVVDIGGGTTDIAILASGRDLVTKSIRHASNDITTALKQFVRDEYSLQIGERTAEEIKIGLGSLGSKTKNRSLVVRGRSAVTGLPQELELTSEKIKNVISKQLRPIAEAIKTLLDEAPTEVVADILSSGIQLTGGGALIPGVDQFLRSETHVDVSVPTNPLTAVVEGSMVALSDPKKYGKIVTVASRE
jgi:rod shape-determining protein MreB